MKLSKLLLCVVAVLAICIGSVSAKTYSNGSVIEDELGYIEVPEDSSYIKFTLPQGTYPSGSKAVLYAQYNVFCYVPGLEYKEPTPDENPYKLAAEYTFTENDIEALKNGPVTFSTTLKFDIMCGGIRVVINETSQKPVNNLVEDNREQGATESEEGVQLTTYSNGMMFESEAKLIGEVLRFIIPQGSYTLGDFIVVAKDNLVIKNITITKEMMETLVNANVEYSMIVNFTDAENISFMVSSYMFDIGDDLVTENSDITIIEDPNDSNKDSKGINPIFIGIIAFAVVLLGGLGFMYLTDKKKKQSVNTNEVAIYTSDEAHQIDDNRIIDAETSDKE